MTNVDEKKSDQGAAGGGGGRILFADDDVAVRDALAEVLRRHGFECVCVASGAEAVAALEGGDYDVLLSDIHMPGNVGLELIESVPALVAGMPVVLLTGRPTVETAARSVRLAVAAYLTKPPEMEELLSVLATAVAEYRGLRILRSGRARLQAWGEELEELERVARRAPQGKSGRTESYLRVMLRQTILMLSDVEQATAVSERSGGGGLAQVEHVAAIRRTVDVLERTKQNFKSKELADLRYQLEKLLERGPGSGAEKKTPVE
ncbi:hypothetical protein CMV30_05805 [Nibricoccus aquaticus]|uniref:Response regulatory domain-containing protein n=1 Tax=Nibricoccus aquaticus TaxID=2576891 RepID=A0A290QDU9_9BACT|nr:response regulator [Nibricoccus aquaticus]ATC63508.1 hypothetical protein CMV30_05805 [Nibricoccus aquaticus]